MADRRLRRRAYLLVAAVALAGALFGVSQLLESHFATVNQQIGRTQARATAQRLQAQANVALVGCGALPELAADITPAATDDMAPILHAMDPNPGSAWSRVTAMQSLPGQGYYSALASGAGFVVRSFSAAVADGDPTPAKLAVQDLADSCNAPP